MSNSLTCWICKKPSFTNSSAWTKEALSLPSLLNMPSTAIAKTDGLGTFLSLALKWKQGKKWIERESYKMKGKNWQSSIYTAEEKY